MARPLLFVSAVSTELRGARRRTAAWLHGLGYDTISQDDFALGAGELRAWLERQIDRCDGVFQLIGDAYGAEPPDCDDPAHPWPDPRYGRCSYTQYELLYARTQGLPTWVIEVGAGCRDAAPATLDLPPQRDGTPPHPDPRGYQQERAALQRAYRERLRSDNHLCHKADNDDQLELRVKGLKDELAHLRQRDERTQRRLGVGMVAVLVGLVLVAVGIVWFIDWRQGLATDQTAAATAEQVAEQQRLTTARIRDHLQQAVDATYERERAAADEAQDWQQRERLRQAAAAQRDAQRARIDDLAASFTEIERQGQASEIFQELTRILDAQDIDAGLAYIASKEPAILADVDRIVADRDRLLAHAEQRIRDTLQPLLTAAGVAETEGRADTARGLYQTLLAKAPDWPEAIHQAMLFHEAQGNQALIRGSVRQFEAEFTAVHRLAQHRADLNPANTQWQRDLSVSHDKLGEVAVVQGRLDAAVAAYGAGLEIAKRLAALDPANTEWQRGLSISHDNLGEVAVAQGRLDAAAAAYGAGLEISKRLAALDPANTEWQRDLYASHWRLADLAERRGEADAAMAHWRQAHALLQGIVDRGLHVSPEDRGYLDQLTLRLRLIDAPAAVAAEFERQLADDPDDPQRYVEAQALYHEVLHDFAAAHRVTAAWVARHPDDLAVRCNLAETLLTSGQTAAARDALAALLGPATATPALPPETMAALRLLELAALTRLAGDGDAAATAALPARRAELRALLDAQPDDFALGWTFDGTRHYLATDPAFAPHRDALSMLFAAADQGRDTLRAQLRRAP